MIFTILLCFFVIFFFFLSYFKLQGHNNEVLSVCWDESGDFLASVSQDTVKIWSVTQGQCIDELSSNGNQFHSCVFHPKYPKFLVIGGYQASHRILLL